MHTTKRFLLLTSCAWCIGFAQTAQADFTGLDIVDRTDLTICQDQTEPEIPYKLDVCEVYAVFDDPTDRLISTAFTNVSTTAQQGFFQHSQNFVNTAPACAAVALEPTLVCDSFVTLGVDCFNLGDGSTLDPDFDSLGFHSLGEVSGGWYNSAPPNGQGDPDADSRVLVARFSYKQNKNTTGDVCLFVQHAGEQEITSFLLQPFDCSLPNGDLPTSSGPNLCPAGATGSCREVNGTAGCDCPECCETVCAENPSCCNDTWSQACVDLACAECDLDECGECAGATGSCYEDNGTPGCDCPECCNLVCCLDPFCCDSKPGEGWTAPCVALANDPDTGCHDACSGTTQEIIYVDGDNQNQTKDGFSWTTAFTDLQDALDLAGCCGSSVEQIWVAKATNPYLPDRGTSDRNETFRMTSGVAIYGGFLGTETELQQRDPEANETILSGDIGTSNSYHVVTAERTDGTGVLDGFTVTAGNCNSGCGLFGGAGVLIIDSSPSLINCAISANLTTSNGGGILIAGGSPSLTDCDLTNNSAGGQGGALHLTDGQTPGDVVLQDCTVTGNQSTSTGGGIYLRGFGATITSCTISSNTSLANGGGLYVFGGSVKFKNCTISGNDATVGGGGLFVSGLSDVELVAACIINDNTAGESGGGIHIQNVNSALLDGCLFSGNSITDEVSGGGAVYANGNGIRMEDCTVLGNSANGNGGGLLVSETGTPMVVGCRFEGNTSLAQGLGGGGAILTRGDDLIVNCVFKDNTSTNRGGAIYNSKTSAPTIVNSLFFGNTATSDGGAMYNFDSDPTVVNCTLSDNTSVLGQAGGIFNDDISNVNLQCHNTVLWGNIAGGVMNEAAQIVAPVGSFVVTYTTIQGLVATGSFDDGTNIGDDPSFVDAPNDDYHLSAGSPAIDHGDNTEVPFDVVDIDHNDDTGERTPLDLDPKPRFIDDPDTPNDDGVPDPGPPPIDELVDMGAYEFFDFDALCEPCPTDVDDSDNTGPFDLAFLLGNWGPDITDPAVLCLDANGDFRIGPFDLAVLLGNWGPCPPP